MTREELIAILKIQQGAEKAYAARDFGRWRESPNNPEAGRMKMRSAATHGRRALELGAQIAELEAEHA